MRLFLGLKIESLGPLKAAMIKLKKDAAKKDWDAKITPPENLHVTIKFLGETDEARLEEIGARARRVAERHAPLELKLRGFDAFPEKMKGRVIWAGVQNKTSLQTLRADLDEVLADMNFASETSFIPHLTVARLRNPHALRDFLSPYERKDFGKSVIKELILFKSEMRGLFPHYEPIGVFLLRGAD